MTVTSKAKAANHKDELKSKSTKDARRARIQELIDAGKSNLAISSITGCSIIEAEAVRVGKMPSLVRKGRFYDGTTPRRVL